VSCPWEGPGTSVIVLESKDIGPPCSYHFQGLWARECLGSQLSGGSGCLGFKLTRDRLVVIDHDCQLDWLKRPRRLEVTPLEGGI
jgi:hypothetical protein